MRTKEQGKHITLHEHDDDDDDDELLPENCAVCETVVETDRQPTDDNIMLRKKRCALHAG